TRRCTTESQAGPVGPLDEAAKACRVVATVLPESATAWYAEEIVHRIWVGGLFMSMTLEQFGIDRLNPQQRCELIDLIWDSLPPAAPFTPPDWHLRELERRIAVADAD